MTARLAAACGPIALKVWTGGHDGYERAMTAEEYVAPIVAELKRLRTT